MYLSLKELCENLKLHPNTIRKYIKEGMPHLRAGRSYRFKLDSVVEWFDKKEQGDGV